MNKFFYDLESLLFKTLCEKNKENIKKLLDEIKNFLLSQNNNMGRFYQEFIHDISGKLTVVFLSFEFNDDITKELDHALCLLSIYKSIFTHSVDWISLEKYIKYENFTIVRKNKFYNDFIDFFLIVIHTLFGKGKIFFEIDDKHIIIKNLDKPIWNIDTAIMHIFKQEIEKNQCLLEIEEDKNIITITKT